MASRIVELSHPIRDGLVTVPNLPAPVIDEFLTREESRKRYAPGTEFSIGRITMVANTGTYVDTPFHRYGDGLDLADMPIERLVELPGVLVDATGHGRSIGPDAFEAADVRGRAVLIRCGWDAYWDTAEYGNGQHPFLTRDAAQWLVDGQAALVGIDSQNVDDTADASRPAHSVLLGAGIPVAEHLTGLGELPRTGFRFSAAPARVVGMGTWPVRAYAVVD